MANDQRIAPQTLKIPCRIGDIVQGRFKNKQPLPNLTCKEIENPRRKFFYEIKCLREFGEEGGEPERKLIQRYEGSLNNDEIRLGRRDHFNIETKDMASPRSTLQSIPRMRLKNADGIDVLKDDQNGSTRYNLTSVEVGRKGKSKAVISPASYMVFKDLAGIKMIF